jgi:cytochrome c2
MQQGEKVIFAASALIGVIAVVMLILGMTGVIHLTDKTETYEFTPETDAGYTLFKTNGCNNCHVLYNMGEWGDGPGLDGEGTRRSREWVSSYLKRPAEMVRGTRHDGKFATDFSEFSDKERVSLEALLMSIKSLPGSPNYPKPPE